MIRLLILASLGATVSASSLPLDLKTYPTNLAWLFGVKDDKKSAENERVLCETEQCKVIAGVIKESMDGSVDPCEDFYDYACGRWANNNPIPENETTWNLWTMVEKNIEQKIEEIINSGPKSDDILAVKLAKKWYKSCMDTDKIEKKGVDPLESTLTRFGGWPLTMEPEEFDDHSYKWQNVDDYYTRLTGIPSFILTYVTASDENEDENILMITTPILVPQWYRLFSRKSNDDEEEDEEEEGEEETEKEASKETESKEENGDENEEESEENNEIGGNVDKEEEEEGEEEEGFHKKRILKKKASKKLSHERKKGREGKMKKRSHVKRSKRSARKVKHHMHREGPEKTNKVKKNSHNTMKKVELNKIHLNARAMKKHLRKQIEDENDDEDTKNEDNTKDEDSDSKGEDDANDEENDDADNDSDSSTIDEVLEAKENYTKYVYNVAKIIIQAREADVPEEKLKKDIDDMVEFLIKLIKITVVDEDFENSTLSSLQEYYDSFDSKSSRSKVNWRRKIGRLLTEASVEVEDDIEIGLVCSNYLARLKTLLDETPNEVIVNYVHWNFVSRMLMASNKELRDLQNNWENKGGDSRETRSEECMMGMYAMDIIGYEYVRKHFSDNITQTALDMIDDIQKEVEYQIKEAEWMDEKTQDFILDKLVNMKRLVGYPSWYRNSTIVKRYFQGLNVGHSFYENLLSFIRYAVWQNLRLLAKTDEDVDTWFIDPVTLNAFFIPTDNSITITAADFQSPMFAYRRPQVINFSIIGVIMAHEVNHGFDSSGRLFDKNGKVMEWLSAMAKAYEKKATCFVDQFDKYSLLKSENVSIENYGAQTVDENIADTMGLQAAFRAYKRRERNCEQPDTALPGLEDFTSDQLFFLSFANLWCEALPDPEEATAMARYDSHSTGRLRVIGSISNSDDFAKAFKCPTGSPMNPKRKCNIWK